MASQGIQNAAGEGIGQVGSRALQAGGKLLYKAALRPSMALQRDFGDIAATGLKEGAPVSEAGLTTVDASRAASAKQAADLLAAKDAERPLVKGYLPAAEGVELGTPPIHPTMPELRDPRSAGVLRGRVMPSPAGTGAYPQQIGAQEVLDRGLPGMRAKSADMPFPEDASNALQSLEQQFTSQRPNAMSLTEANRLKGEAQDLADTAYRAADAGNPVNSTNAAFNKGIATGTRQAIESRAPDVGPINAKTQDLIGLQRALENANMRNVSGIGLSPRAFLGDFMPNVSSRMGIGANTVGQSGVLSPTLKAAIIALLTGRDPQQP
jgi:hypothetical protein